MSEFTKGPWTLAGEAPGKLQLWGGEHHNEWVGELHSIPDKAMSTARLIAAAPALYEALENIAEIERSHCYEAYPESNPLLTTSNDLRFCGDIARAALLRAGKGEEGTSSVDRVLSDKEREYVSHLKPAAKPEGK